MALLLSCSGERKVATEPNIIFIVIDTLRADHLSCYGYSRPTSPNIDAFAEGADFYERAYSTSSWTVPSHGSMFTGKYPFEHGSHSFLTDLKGDAAKAKVALYEGLYPLDEANVTIAEVLRDEGYQTGAVVANTAYVSPMVGLDQGFDDFIRKEVYADKLNEDVTSWISAHASDPFFLFINYKDVHRPYNARPRPGFLDEPPSQEPLLIDVLRMYVMPARDPVSEELAQQVIDQYDTAIANVDDEIGELFAWLKEKGLYEDTVIVLTSDHGEAFGEHHLVAHDVDLYEPLIFVPLIVKAPGQREGKVIKSVGSITDIAGLILDAFPQHSIGDYSFRFPDRPGNHPVLSEIHYARPFDLEKEWRDRLLRVQQGIIEWPHKYVHSTDGNHLLFDLDADPGEENNLFAAEPERAEEMRRRIEEYKKSREATTIQNFTLISGEIDEQTLKDAESLGYLK